MKNYTVVPFDSQNNGLVMIGYLYQPEGEGPYDCAVICHGTYDDLNNNTDIAEKLASQGMVVINFDFNEEQAEEQKNSTISEFKDLDAVINKAKEVSDLKNIYLIGITQGAYLSALTAKKEETDVAKLILMDPVFETNDLTGVEGFKNPTLILCSKGGQMTPTDFVDKASKIYPNCDLVQVEGKAQGFTGQASENTIDTIVKFLEK